MSDTASVLSPSFAAALEEKLAAYEHQTGHQFAFVSIESLDGGVIEDYCLKAAEALRLGDEKRDDGALFCLSKKDRKLRIEVGYGLEGAIPDALAARIIRYEVKPHLQKGDFDGGVEAAFSTMMKAAAGEAVRVGPPARSENGAAGLLHYLPILLIVLLVLSGRGGFLPWLFLFGGGGGGGRRDGGYGGFSGGGGGFGGGGASGDW